MCLYHLCLPVLSSNHKMFTHRNGLGTCELSIVTIQVTEVRPSGIHKPQPKNIGYGIKVHSYGIHLRKINTIYETNKLSVFVCYLISRYEWVFLGHYPHPVTVIVI